MQGKTNRMYTVHRYFLTKMKFNFTLTCDKYRPGGSKEDGEMVWSFFSFLFLLFLPVIP